MSSLVHRFRWHLRSSCINQPNARTSYYALRMKVTRILLKQTNSSFFNLSLKSLKRSCSVRPTLSTPHPHATRYCLAPRPLLTTSSHCLNPPSSARIAQLPHSPPPDSTPVTNQSINPAPLSTAAELHPRPPAVPSRLLGTTVADRPGC